MDLRGSGFIIWLTGMRRSGKSTLARLLTERLVAAGRPVELIDEDGEARLLLEGLSDSKEDHSRKVARMGFVAKAISRQSGIAVCAALSPYRDARETLRREARRFLEVFVDCDMETLQKRDSEGIYRRALASEITQVPGVDVPYEPPVHPEVTVRSDALTPQQAAQQVFQALVDGRLLGPAEFGRLTGGLRPKRSRRSSKGRAGTLRKPSAKQAARKPQKKAVLRSARSVRR